MKSKNRLNYGIIGLGNMGRNHARIASELPNIRLIAVSDLIESRGKAIAKKYKCHYFANYNQLLEVKDLEAVCVAVSTPLHYQVGKSVLQAGLHLLIEKPFAATVAEANELVRIASRVGKKIMVGHTERFNPAITVLKSLIDEGKLGQIVSLNARRVGLAPPVDHKTSVILELGIHEIDLFCFLLGRLPNKIFGSGLGALHSTKQDCADLLFLFGDKDKITCFLQINWLTPIKIRQLSVTGTKGHVQLDFQTQKVSRYESRNYGDFKSFSDFKRGYWTPKRINIPVKFREPLKEEIKKFADWILLNKKPHISVQEAVRALYVAEKAIASTKNNRVIRL